MVTQNRSFICEKVAEYLSDGLIVAGITTSNMPQMKAEMVDRGTYVLLTVVTRRAATRREFLLPHDIVGKWDSLSKNLVDAVAGIVLEELREYGDCEVTRVV